MHSWSNVFEKAPSAKASRIAKPSPVPDWGIGLVLKGFSRPPFEPIQQASIEALAYKALVLVALMLGARRGELIALRRDQNFIRPVENWSFVLLYSDPFFMPKTARARRPIS